MAGRVHSGEVPCARARVAKGCGDSVANCSRLVAAPRILLWRLTSLLPKNDGCPQPLKNTSACCEGEYFQAEGSGWIRSRRRRRRGSPGGAKKAMGASWWAHSCSLGIHFLAPLFVRGSWRSPQTAMMAGAASFGRCWRAMAAMVSSEVVS